jgi:hypothetical protein
MGQSLKGEFKVGFSKYFHVCVTVFINLEWIINVQS